MKSSAEGISQGRVYLVGAGPGDPELITLKGLRLIQTADCILYDRLAPRELLDAASAGAEKLAVGKSPGCVPVPQEEINRLLIERALEGKQVVRLKGGDPFVFGRGREELQACRRAGVACEVVPGVSSALAGPAAAEIPVTHRGLSRQFTVVTAETGKGAPGLDYSALATAETLVVLMGRRALPRFCRSLIEAGKPAETPAACIERATTPFQRVVRGTLESLPRLADLHEIHAPAVTVIGAVAALAGACSRLSFCCSSQIENQAETFVKEDNPVRRQLPQTF